MSRIFTTDFTRPFLDELAAHMMRSCPTFDFGRIAVVFGGKRPAFFLERSLRRKAHACGKEFVAPHFFTIDAFMDELADVDGARRPAGPMEDAFDIYQLVRRSMPELLAGRDPFPQFLPWANDILNFIAQLDIEDVPESALDNIGQSACIGYPVPESINQLLGKMIILRQGFHERLRAQGRTCRGLQYLRAKQNVARWDTGRFDEIIFANFFYFTRTEEAVARHLHASGKATLIFQGDQAKWPVLERMAKRFSCELKEGAAPTPTSFKLDVYSASDVHAEAASVRDILAAVADKARTVVVLPDAGALVPLLSAFPDDTGPFNVSMGYPLKRSSLYLLFDAMFKAEASRRDAGYYAKDYLALMQHPFVKNLRLAADPACMRVLVHKIEEVLKGRSEGAIAGRSFVGLADIEAEAGIFASASETLAGMGVVCRAGELLDLLHQAHELLLGSWGRINDLGAFAALMRAFIKLMTEKTPLGEYPLNVTIAARIEGICAEFDGPLLSSETFGLAGIFRIFESRLGAELVRFSGTPLKGLQVLGLEETRSLDFDDVIIMDVNEGVLPDVDTRAALIPREVMAQLGIDRPGLDEEIQRYQFMRIISSAKRVHLVCQKNREKEPSRFVEELVWEAQRQSGRLDPYPTQRAAFALSVSPQARQAQKTPAIMAFLKDLTYSPSSINTYMADPYAFYMTHVLGLREQEDLLDEADAAFIGNFLHKLLDELYKPLAGRPPDFGDAFEERLWALFERDFKGSFEARMRSDAFMVKAMMQHKLRAFLGAERARAPFIDRIVALEKELVCGVPLASGTIRLKVRIDRIDALKGGELLVLDYKTGSTDRLPKKPLVLSQKPGRRELFDNVRSFQLPLYMYAVKEAFGPGRLNAALYSLRDTGIKALFTDKYPPMDTDEFLKPFLVGLDGLVGEVLDPQRPFVEDDLRKFDF